MKIEKAIEILSRKVASPFVRANKDSLEATQLGIEALKRIKAERELYTSFYQKPPPWIGINLLPGETKE